MLSKMFVPTGVVVGVLGALWFSHVVAMGRAPGQQLASGKAQEPQHGAAQAQPVSPREKQAQAQKYEPDCEKSDKREECFLQLRALWAAEGQARGAIEQADYTWLGLWLLGFTLLATGIAARAAWKTVRTMQGIGRTELRPYVFRSGWEIHWLHPAGKPKEIDAWRLSVVWQNTGVTPAKRVQARISADLFKGAASPADKDFPDIGAHNTTAGSVGPKQTVRSRTNISLDKLVDAWKTIHMRDDDPEKRRVYYWAWIEYDGLGGQPRHRTEICGELMPVEDPASQDARFIEAIVTDFNAADEDCVYKPKTK